MNNIKEIVNIIDNSGNVLGPECDIAISSRIRLARNLADFAFPNILNADGRKQVANNILNAKNLNNLNEYKFIDFENLNLIEAEALAESRIVSQEFAKDKRVGRGLLTNQENGVYVMINEEDHLRIQCIKPGFAFEEAYLQADNFDNLADLNYAFDENLGYLTQCPSNLGTGLRASVMLHLPALSLNGQIRNIAIDLPKLGLAIRGLYGEGSEANGNLYQVSNNITLGANEEQTIEKIKSVAQKIIELERYARGELFKGSKETKDYLTDKIMRAYGTLKYAHIMSSSEFLQLYSEIRLGVSLGIIKDLNYKVLDNLLVKVMPANLELNNSLNNLNGVNDVNGMKDLRERDIARAKYIKENIN